MEGYENLFFEFLSSLKADIHQKLFVQQKVHGKTQILRLMRRKKIRFLRNYIPPILENYFLAICRVVKNLNQKIFSDFCSIFKQKKIEKQLPFPSH